MKVDVGYHDPKWFLYA